MAGDVVVLGAGFTRAFFPDAPLLLDLYPLCELIERYAALGAIHILQTEVDSSADGRVNLERLLTRLSSPMPYESGEASAAELTVLRTAVEELFERRVREATNAASTEGHWLKHFAEQFIDGRIAGITFNYDEAFDRELFQVNQVTQRPFANLNKREYWHPDGGYGFFCAPSESTVVSPSAYMDRDQTPLLKLHGSVNWRIRRGARHPFALGDVVHHETWSPRSRGQDASLEVDIERHLEPRPLLVPPILAKTDLANEPVLQRVWAAARDELESADRVTFVGYSFPPTDLAARFLFSEAIPAARRKAIRVVDFRSEEERPTLIESYRSVFGEMGAEQFSWDGAIEWIKRTWPSAHP